jgi:hypothetical protein
MGERMSGLYDELKGKSHGAIFEKLCDEFNKWAHGANLMDPHQRRLVEIISAKDERIKILVTALEQCKLEVEQFQRLSHGKKQFPDTKGMEMAEAILKELRGDA